VKGFIFYTTTFLLALPLFVIMLLLAPFVAAFDKHRRLAQHFVNNIWAKVSTIPYYGVEIVGKENLPAADTPAVYVSNHQSFLDIFTLFHLDRPFKFVSKTPNFFIPIVGWSMFLTGHIKLNRIDKRSQIKCLGDCKDLLAKGASVLFFPEGTRSKDGKMAEFKKGAFSVASKAKVPIVPVTLIGTGHLMPNGQEGKMYNGRVKMIVHPPIAPGSPDATMEQARAQIASALPA
ncbi:glycerol-3-phosphate 1-acyltransferase, partial [Coccomyxa subellipsoidea C-169]